MSTLTWSSRAESIWLATVRFLGVLRRAAIDPRLRRQITCAELAADQPTGGGDRLGGDLDAVGAHVGDQAAGIAVELDTFVEPLRHRHRAAGAKPELARG